jgi:putative heme-binding domain-containing protein
MPRILRVLPLLLPVCLAHAADPRGDHPGTDPSTPQEQLARFHVPPGFEVQLVAAEPEIQKPINLNFDAAGRLWVSGSEMYPWPAGTDAAGHAIPDFEKAFGEIATAFHAGDKAPPPPYTARDSVRILSDFSSDGHAHKVSIFADALNIPSGIQPLPRKPGAKGDSAIVYSIPYIWRMEDTTGSGHADKREILYGPFGYLDTHGGSSSYIQWIDGWIYGTHGFRNHSEVRDRSGKVTIFDSGNTYRFRPDGSKIEHYTHGQTNPFGLAFDPLGNLYSADSHSKPVYLLLHGGYYEGIGKQHDGLGFAPAITSDDHGSSAIGGIMYYADDKWPEEFRGNLFNGNPVTQKINRDKLEWHGSTPKAIRQPDFLSCDDPWFRPVNLKLGPDGALYIADFYNAIIGHYEVPLVDPHRDHTHGRIWRVIWRGERGEKRDAPAATLRDLSKLDAAALVEKLADTNLEVRRLATNELTARFQSKAGVNDDGVSQFLLTANSFQHGPNGSKNHASLHVRALLERIMSGIGERLSASDADIVSGVEQPDPGTAAFAMRLYSGRADGAEKVTILALRAFSMPDATVWRAAAEVLWTAPNRSFIAPLLARLNSSDSQDSELIYAIRLALKACLSADGAYSTVTEIAARNAADADLLADITLAIKTPDAAEFLLAQLERTRFSAPRAGEYLKHAVLNLPTEKIGSIVSLIAKLGDAPLPQRLALADGISQAARQRGLKLPDEITAWSQRAMLDALAGNDEALLKRAVEAVREVSFDAKFAPLEKIVRDAKRDGTLRRAALDATANLPASHDLLTATLNDPHQMILRKRAAELLVLNGDTAAVLAALPNAPQELAIPISAALAKTDAGCASLLGVIEAGKASPRVLINNAVAGPLTARPKPLRDRAAALTKDLPPEDARLNAVIAERAKAYAAAKTNAAHGAQVFAQNCAACHRFRSAGGNVGPNVDGVVARGVARLIEDILDPNRNVDPLFRQTTFETAGGGIFIGANVRDQGDSILFADLTGKDITLKKSAIKKQSTSALSLMPPVFESAIPAQDFNDLLAYLLSPAP